MSAPLLKFNPGFMKRHNAGDTFSGYVAGLHGSISSTQTIANQTETAVSWTSEVLDDSWGWAANDTSFTVPAGVNAVVVCAMFATNTFDEDRARALVKLNGTVVTTESNSRFDTMNASTYMIMAVSPGDVISVDVYIETGPADLGEWDGRTFVSIEGY